MSKKKNLSTFDEGMIPSLDGYSFGIAVSEWNEKITGALLDGAQEILAKHQVPSDQIHIIQVPGSFELPTAAKWLLAHHKLDAVICLGCVITGDTKHNEYISHAVANGIMSLSITSGTPVIFGLLTPDTYEQAEDRAGGKHGNKGAEAAYTAIRMALTKKTMKKEKSTIGF
jgi:6,7-dimethyl-8-ribityllumazine synthase